VNGGSRPPDPGRQRQHDAAVMIGRHSRRTMAETTERSAVLIVRAWVEGGPVPRLTARITQSRDLRRTEQVSFATTVPDEILAAVRAWLDAVLDPTDPSPTRHD
jgi:hypothetical protein